MANNPTIREPTAGTDGSPLQWGPKSQRQVAQLIKGTHPTEKIQASSIDGLQPTIDFNDVKQAVRIATLENHDLTKDFENGSTIDGVVIATGNRVLIKSQTDEIENGIYIVNLAGSPTRADDFDLANKLVRGAIFICLEGTLNALKIFALNSADPTEPGNDAIEFVEVAADKPVPIQVEDHVQLGRNLRQTGAIGPVGNFTLQNWDVTGTTSVVLGPLPFSLKVTSVGLYIQGETQALHSDSISLSLNKVNVVTNVTTEIVTTTVPAGARGVDSGRNIDILRAANELFYWTLTSDTPVSAEGALYITPHFHYELIENEDEDE